MAAAASLGVPAEGPTIIQPQSQLITIKLTEANYLVWRQQISAAIRGYGLENFLTGEHPIPNRLAASTSETPGVINPEYVRWIRQDQLLVSWLLSSLSERILVTTVGLNTSKEIWECLESGFASQSRAKIMQYKLQLQTLKKGTMTMRDYLNKVKACCDILAASGQRVSDEDQTLHILSGLGNEYNPVMVSITSRIEPCVLREVHAILLSFESRLEGSDNIGQQFNTDGSVPNINMSIYNAGRGHNSRITRGRGQQQYQHFRGRGGYRGNSSRGRGGRNSTFGMTKCQLCQRTNHTECSSRAA